MTAASRRAALSAAVLLASLAALCKMCDCADTLLPTGAIREGGGGADKSATGVKEAVATETNEAPLILGGDTIANRSNSNFKYLARVSAVSKFAQVRYICTGALISTTHVLTAGHCIKKTFMKIFRLKFASWEVTLGDVSQSQYEYTEQLIQGTGMTSPFYPGVYSGPDGNDIGLIKLKRAAQLNAYVQVVALPSDKNSTPQKNSFASVAGWGVSASNTGELTSSDLLHSGNATIVDNSECSIAAGKRDELLCLRPYYDSSSTKQTLCYGDDGAPVVQNGVLVGVVSYFMDMTVGVFCEQGKYAAAVMVAPHLKWIKIFVG